jgi:hypothetical protein
MVDQVGEGAVPFEHPAFLAEALPAQVVVRRREALAVDGRAEPVDGRLVERPFDQQEPVQVEQVELEGGQARGIGALTPGSCASHG